MEKLHHLQEQVLKKEIRELQRAQKRESTNPEYLTYPISFFSFFARSVITFLICFHLT